ncbi:Mavicyanin [Cardamine amara subsp. amara]|uniref:Mavicyanin n=1 Tax=Cardamine amara subsp. amara TaxID=228776 RepID=A0ABD1BGQ5_CARAN
MMAARTVAALSCLVMMLRLSEAAVYKVGDSAGWTTIANVDYKQWASTKTFHIGDTILFEYNPQFHNVMRVTHPMYRSCNNSNPISTFTTGNDSITLTNHGHHFFFCGVPGHCLAGQKLDLNVLRPASTTPLSDPPTSSSPPPLTTNIPAAEVPGPSPSLAASLPSPAMARFTAVVALLVSLVFANFAS